jgi:hypothetical protein
MAPSFLRRFFVCSIITCGLLLARGETCVTPPSGIVSWWTGADNANDSVFTNHGTVIGNTSYAVGEVNDGFVFDGSGDIVKVGNSPTLQLQNFTVEAWVKRNSSAAVSNDPQGSGHIFGYGNQGYVFLVQNDGTVVLNKVGVSTASFAPFKVTDTNWHHLAVTKTNTTIWFYLDGTGYSGGAFNATFVFNTEAAIGGRADSLGNSFLGMIDEVTVYNRALTNGEILTIYNASTAGKCSTIPPTIVKQTPSVTVAVGTNVELSVTASGTAPLSYQWQRNGIELSTGTNSNFLISNAQTNNSGSYSVTITNSFGSSTGSNLFLAVIETPASLFDDFEPTIDSQQWSSFGGTVLVTNYGGYVSSSNSLWFGGAGSRFATTATLNTSAGGMISFYLRLASGASSTWETVDLPSEGVVVEYSVNGGTNWVNIATYDTSAYTTWTFRQLSIPVGAQSNATQFRWRQLSNSGSGTDNWALDDVQITGPVPPVIVAQPQTRTAYVGDSTIFSVAVTGSTPLYYQWQKDSVSLSAATNSTFAIDSVALPDAASYSVTVSNAFGSVVSSNAILTVSTPACVTSPSGIVGWWPAEGNASDYVAGNHGTVLSGATYAAGKAGQAFDFNGTSGNVLVPASTSLNVRSLTIEGWIFPRDFLSRPVVEFASSNSSAGVHFWVNTALSSSPPGALYANIRDVAVGSHWLSSGAGLMVTNQWQHVAVTYDSTNGQARIYLNGAVVAQSNLGTNFTPATAYPLNFGYRPSGSADPGGNSRFAGKIDEMSVYNRALSSNEIAAVYNASSAGKCSEVAPVFISQPQSRSAFLGQNATFSVSVYGSSPLTYQWLFNDTNIIAGATNASMTLTNVSAMDAGFYSASVSNPSGRVFSSNATLVVLPPPTCTPAPDGLLSWWSGDGTTDNIVASNHGILIGNATYATAEVNQGFLLDGAGDVVKVGPSPALQLQNFTIEAWVKRNSSSAVSLESGGSGHIFGFGNQGYVFLFQSDGTVMLNKAGVSTASSSPFKVTDTNWHHLAVTKTNTTVFFYLDGTAYSSGSFGATFVFNTEAAIGGRADLQGGSFLGMIDDVAIYNRVLTNSEIQAIYNASSAGKCSAIAPVIAQNPVPQSANTGENVTFSVSAFGSNPLSFQWRLNTTNIAGGTDSKLILSAVSQIDAGNYSVIVSNVAGSVTSSNVALVVIPPPPCTSPAQGVVGWWPAEGSAGDFVGGNHGTTFGGVGYGTGKVGQAYDFDGITGNILVPVSTSLNVRSLTIEGWIFPRDFTSRPLVEFASSNSSAGVHFWVNTSMTSTPTGNLYANIRDVAVGSHWLSCAAGLTVTNQWQHVALTYDSTNGDARIYLNGAVVAQSNLGTNFTPATAYPLNFGYRPGGSADPGGNSRFAGKMDEMSIYNRALSATEIAAIYNASSAGKCSNVAPIITSQPQSQTAFIGQNVTFSVSASGSSPLSYQWLFNGTNIITGATNASMTLASVHLNQGGAYSVVVTNLFGSAISGEAHFSISFPPAVVQVMSTNTMAGTPVSVPIVIVANGNENAVGFSLNFPTQQLTYVRVTLGDGAIGGTLLVNASQATAGKVGVAVALPSDAMFAAGTQEVARIDFTSFITTNATAAPITFGDVPLARQVSDSQAQTIAANYTNGIIVFAPTDLEGDVAPRPSGNRAVTITDWVQIGRFVARLDTPTNGAEYQRIDCAPRSSLGDGQIKVTDWVQAGRYAAALDFLVAVGGPTSDSTQSVVLTKVVPTNLSGTREIRVSDATAVQRIAVSLPVNLEAQGDENALGFSLSFDATRFSYTSAVLGADAGSATLVINKDQIEAGKVGFALALQAGTTFIAGKREVLKVNLTPIAATGTASVAFSSLPVPASVSDANANELPSSYAASLVTINPPPSLEIATSGTNRLISWPAWATGFALESATNLSSPLVNWTNATLIGQTNNSSISVTLPAEGETKLFRLRHQ